MVSTNIDGANIAISNEDRIYTRVFNQSILLGVLFMGSIMGALIILIRNVINPLYNAKSKIRG
ncbi:hypothetical protein lbkm_3764 [Lachnospiraceae bacterium KM106-2]|nr:hypothetical protein lbkm_3764 [Lachnospiraceae bacterium KM106-2]